MRSSKSLKLRIIIFNELRNYTPLPALYRENLEPIIYETTRPRFAAIHRRVQKARGARAETAAKWDARSFAAPAIGGLCDGPRRLAPRPRPHGSRRNLMGPPRSAPPNATNPPAGFEVAGEFWIGAPPPAARGDFGRQAQTDHTGERRNPNSFDIAQETEYSILPGPSSLGPTFPRLSSLHPILPAFPPKTFPCERLRTTCNNTESSRRRWL